MRDEPDRPKEGRVAKQLLPHFHRKHLLVLQESRLLISAGSSEPLSGTLFAETIFLLTVEQGRVEAVFAIPGLALPKRITWASFRSKVDFSGYTAAPWAFFDQVNSAR
jgi:hypothetical protein